MWPIDMDAIGRRDAELSLDGCAAAYRAGWLDMFIFHCRSEVPRRLELEA